MIALKWKIIITIITATIQILGGIAILFNNKMWSKASYSRIVAILLNAWLWLAGGFFFYGSLYCDTFDTLSNAVAGLLFLFLFAYLPSCAGLRGVIGAAGNRAGIVFYSESYEA